MTPPKIISVVRDFEMYEKCVRTNLNFDGCTLCPIDNRAKNENISVCYNRALRALPADADAWLVFCHEDFDVRSPLVDHLRELSPLDALYGPIGASTRKRFGLYYQWKLVGSVVESDKNGANRTIVGTPVRIGARADTLDCQCLIVHSSLIRKYSLTFDEHLSFDLYVEDFCMSAMERHGIPSLILPIECQHWSKGCVQQRYFDQLTYLKVKWPNAAYTGTATQLIGGGGAFLWRLEVALKRLIQRLLRRTIGS